MLANSNIRARRRRAEQVQQRQPSFAIRRAALGIGLVLAFVAVVASAIHRQVVETAFLKNEGEKRFLRSREIPAPRGMILDRNGEPLAISTTVATISGDPKRLIRQARLLPDLALALEIPQDQFIQRISAYAQKGKRFMYLRRRVEPRIARAVDDLVEHENLSGVAIENEFRRFYPGGEMFAHLIGFTNIDDKGQEGMELAFNDRLAATPGLRRVILDGRGRLVEEVEQIKPPRHGRELVLSLDRRLQFLAYRELKRAVHEHKAQSASAALLNIRTGEVLALVNQPSFNPNKARTGPPENRRNRSLTDVFEPGSTVKPFVVAAALDAGVINPQTPVDTTPGYYRVGSNRVRDYRNLGPLDVTSVITKSSNIGVVKIAQRLDRAALWQAYDNLGFGDRTQSQFPGERSGHLSHFNHWSAFEHATHAFGYGLNVTTLQLARAYAVIAADGLRRPVTLLRREQIPDGDRVFSAKTSRKVREMMETVVSVKGTARRAVIPGYRVAGKTGTAKKATSRGYTAGKYQSVFAGMAPASHPRFVMVVMVDEPGGREYYGGIVAAPTFAKVMQAALRLYNVPPDAAGISVLVASDSSTKP